MRIVHEPSEYQALCNTSRTRGLTVGFVPTMGALHAGHGTLISQAKKECAFVAVSIFVNPTQFGPNEDFAKYPRVLDRDTTYCQSLGVDCIFAPHAEKMYGLHDETRVIVSKTAEHLCGQFRPGHFQGVATIVTKLLNLTGPSRAYFGQKDYQQLQVIKRMVSDLFLPIEVIGVPTVRESDGLALSSRNTYLSAEERRKATVIPQALQQALLQYQNGVRHVGTLLAEVRKSIEPIATRIDYIAIADASTVIPLHDQDNIDKPVVLAVAIRVGTTRLIDNVVLT